MKTDKSKGADTCSDVSYTKGGETGKVTGKLKTVMLLVRLIAYFSNILTVLEEYRFPSTHTFYHSINYLNISHTCFSLTENEFSSSA